MECRDRKVAVGVPDVEAFAKKCERCGINGGIFVSPTGFAGTALVYARTVNVRCLSLSEHDDPTWFLNSRSLPKHSFEITNVVVDLHAHEDPPRGNATSYKTPAGVITSVEFAELVQSRINQQGPHDSAQTKHLDLHMGGWTAVFANGVEREIQKGVLEYEIRENIEHLPYQTLAYVDETNGKTISVISIVKDPTSGAYTLIVPAPDDKVTVYTTMDGLSYNE